MTITITHKNEKDELIFIEVMCNLGYEIYKEKDKVFYMRKTDNFLEVIEGPEEGWWSREIKMARSVFRKLLGKK